MGHKGKCLGSIVLLICFGSTFAHRLLLDPSHMMRKSHRDHEVKPYVHESDGPGPDFKEKPSLREKDHENILPELEPTQRVKPYAHGLELENGVMPKVNPIVINSKRGRRFGSGTSLGYGFGRVMCGTCGEGPAVGGGGGGYFPPLRLGHEGSKSDKGTTNMMSQAVGSPLP